MGPFLTFPSPSSDHFMVDQFHSLVFSPSTWGQDTSGSVLVILVVVLYNRFNGAIEIQICDG